MYLKGSERSIPQPGARLLRTINSLTEYFMRVIEMIRGASAMQGGKGDAFWLDSLRGRDSDHLTSMRLSLFTGSLGRALFMKGVPALPNLFAPLKITWHAKVELLGKISQSPHLG